MGKLNEENLKGQIESILLVAEKPVSAKEIASCTGSMNVNVQKALAELIKDYQERGIKIIKKGEYYIMATDPQHTDVVSRFLNEELRHDLTPAAIEALSIVTYKQPITRGEIEEIRGVNSDQVVRNLLIRGLIAEIGRRETPGRPILYGTTMEFLQFFGLSSEKDLPEFKEEIQESLVNIDTIKSEN
jgi:segregation and condensation protein B